MSKRERIYLRVGKGCLLPADNYAAGKMRERGYHMGDLVKADITKPNNPGFHRLLHRIGQLCARNIDAFAGMEPHKVLKRIQIEGNIACEELGIRIPGIGMAIQRIPTSLSFDSMDDGERHEVARAMCRHIAEQYWPDMAPEKIEEMADSMVEEA